MEKAAIFIDGGYFNRVVKSYGNFSIDYLKVCNNICSVLNIQRLRTYVYHCLPLIRGSNKDDEKRHAEMQRFLSKLRRLPRFEVQLGKLQLIGGKFKQKMVDVLMSLDVVDICFYKHVDHVVLIAGDADFVPAVRKAKSHGVIIHLFCDPSSVHNELLDEIDELHIIDKDFIDKCRK